MMKRVISYSGGLSSWACAKIVAERYGTDDMVLLFADTKYEDEDLYRFLHESAANIGCPVTVIADGRDVWQVFRDERFLGNSRVDPCSKILKRQLLDKWVLDNCDLSETVQYVGYRWDEKHRFYGSGDDVGFQARMLEKGHRFEAPLIDLPQWDKPAVLEWCEREGMDPPATYDDDLGGNCGGRCVKAGQKHWATLLRKRPDSYADVERRENEFREFLGKDVSILRCRRGGKSKPLTLTMFRERMQAGEACANDGKGGCRCMDIT